MAQNKKLSSLSFVVRLVLLALVYIAAAKFGLSLAFSVDQATTIWPPTGIALAVLVFGRRWWPGITIGAFVVNALTNEPLWVAALIAVGNTLEAVVGASLLNRFGFRPTLSRAKDVLLLASVAALSSLVSASVGAGSLLLGGLIPPPSLVHAWLIWWVGDLTGALVVAPLLMVWLSTEVANRSRWIEAGLLAALSLLASTFVFGSNMTNANLIAPFPYLLLPFVLWAALRFTQKGSVALTGLLALSAIAWTINGFGPFSGNRSTEHAIILLHTYLLIISVSSLTLAASVSTRIESEEKLKRRTLQLEKAQAKSEANLAKMQDMEKQLREANRRVTNILEDVLETGNRTQKN